MRLHSLAVMLLLATSTYAQGTASPALLHPAPYVSLVNVSHPFTPLEPNDTVQVSISFAARNGTVTVVQNGGAPYVMGTTDQSGFWSTTATETVQTIGDYVQYWYVNGVQLGANNPYLPDFPFAPALPSFTVFPLYTGSNDPGELPGAAYDTCNGSKSPTAFWAWEPVAYYSTSSYGLAVVGDAAEQWWEGPVPFTEGSEEVEDILVEDDSSLPSGTAGRTLLYNQTCDEQCYGSTDQCTGECLDDSAIYYVDILLNTPRINAIAAEMNVPGSAFATAIITHELGHALQLGDALPSLISGRCSEVKGVMYGFPVSQFSCGATSPTSSDLNELDAIYPWSPPYCPVGDDYCYYGVPCD